jgi:hypothetical protein
LEKRSKGLPFGYIFQDHSAIFFSTTLAIPARREFIAKIRDPKTFAEFEQKKSQSLEYGDTNYNPISVVFELIE